MRSRTPRRASCVGRSSRARLEPVVEGVSGAAAVADCVLLVGCEFRHRAAVVVVVGDEGRVVAESTVAARLGCQLTRAAALEQPLLAVVGHVNERADVRDAAVTARCTNLVEQLLQVLLVAGGL